MFYNNIDDSNHSMIIKQSNHEKLNGRINLLDQQSTDIIFKMQERIAVKNKTTEYREAMVGNFEDSVLSRAYFSAENIQIIQNGIRAGVYEMSNKQYVVPPQNIDTIKIIMRSIFMQYSVFSPDNIREQIERLNRMVLNYAVTSVYKEAVGYVKYLEDQSVIVTPMLPPSSSGRVYNDLQLKPFF